MMIRLASFNVSPILRDLIGCIAFAIQRSKLAKPRAGGVVVVVFSKDQALFT